MAIDKNSMAVGHIPSLTWHRIKMNEGLVPADYQVGGPAGTAWRLAEPAGGAGHQEPAGLGEGVTLSAVPVSLAEQELKKIAPKEAPERFVAGKIPIYHPQSFGTGLGAELDEALSLWELLSRTETRKYAALGEAVCNDGRLRGLFRFCGHPQGRFSYPLIQLDNLPVCRSAELSELRDIVRSGEFNSLDSQCESVTDILTQLFVTSFVPRRKCRLLVAEYPAMEQRILDWLVRDDWEARASSRNYVQDEQPRVSEYFHDDPRVTRLCLDIDNAIRRCLTHPTVAKTHGLLFSGYNGTLCIELPSGRALCYREPEIMFGVDGFSIIMYAGMNKDGKWDIMQGNGARFLRDIVQGLARDVLLDAMQRLTDANYLVVLHLANKVVVESEEPAALMAISAVMEQPPHWAKEMQLTTQGYACNRYLEKKQRPSRR